MDDGLGVVAVHVQDGRLHDLGDLRAVGAGARVGRQGGEADLVVDHEMDGAADAVAAEIAEIEALGHQPLTGERRVAVHQDRHHLAALGVAALVLLGACLAQHHGIDRLEVRGIGRQRDVDGGAVELAVGRGAEMVFHVARAAHFLGLRGTALELGEQCRVALVQDVHEGVQAAAMGHADHYVADAELAAALQDLLDAGDHRFAAIEAEALGADELDAEIALQPLRLDDPLQDHAAAFGGELGAVLDVLDALLDPRLLVGIGDVHVFDADLAAVGLAQAVPDLAQGGRFTQAQRAEDQDRAVPVAIAEAVGRRIELAVPRLADQAQRIEVGFEMAADAVGADQQEGPGGVQGGGADLLLGLVGDGGRRRRAVALHVAVGGRRQAVGVHGADDVRTVGRPRRAAHLGQDIALLLAQRLEERAPFAVDGARIAEIALVELFDERRIGAEQEGCLLRSHLPVSSSSSPPSGERTGEGVRTAWDDPHLASPHGGKEGRNMVSLSWP